MVISSPNTFSHSYARKRLIGIRESIHPPRAQVPLSGESERQGQAAWGCGGWWWWLGTGEQSPTSSSLPFHPLDHRNHLKLMQACPSWEGLGCKCGKFVGPIPPQPHPSRATHSGRPDPVVKNTFLCVLSKRSMPGGDLNPPDGLREGAQSPQPLKKRTSPAL